MASPLPRPARLPLPQAGLPLYQRAGMVVLVADDPALLQSCAESMAYDWPLATHLSSRSCLNRLQQQPPAWEADYWAQQEVVDGWRAGSPILPLIVRYWMTRPHRNDLVKVCVADANMAGLDGLSMFTELVQWPGRRVLLTPSQPDPMEAHSVRLGVVDQCVSRDAPEFGQRMREAVGRALEMPNARYDGIWEGTLDASQLQLVRSEPVGRELRRQVRQFTEWVVLGDPFGVLGLRDDGSVWWSPLQPVPARAGGGQLGPAARLGLIATVDDMHSRWQAAQNQSTF